MNKTMFRQTLSLLFAAFLAMGLLVFCPVKAHAAGETIDNAISIQLNTSNPTKDVYYTKTWSYENARDAHFVRFELTMSSQVSFSVINEGSSKVIPLLYTVYRADGQPIWEGAHDMSFVGLDAGVYYASMRPDSSLYRFQKGDAPVEIQYGIRGSGTRSFEIEPNNDPSTAKTLPRGGLQQGRVGRSDNKSTSDTKDFWSFEAEAGHSYRMVFTQYGINGTDVKAYVTQPGAKINTKTPLTCQRRTKDGHLFVDVPVETSGTAYLLFSYSGDYTTYSIRMFDLTDHNLVEEKGRWNQKNGKWYYLDSLDDVVTGWRYIGRKWYFFDKSGVMKTGWLYDGGKWYYMDSSGVMKTGWQYTGGKWYYMDDSGAMLTGWQRISRKWYYLENSGAMVTGWKQLGGKWYYMDSSGAMVTGTQTISGKTYRFNTSGAWIN
ncbi:MAG: N-acetylmuramoyl-L-alanine amidase family protein [Oscillospiraceae bacterium]|nr:N-acetylmuramoyl-L-alanine amidase family protein [Oscillospiraceae bacterium]